MISKLLNITLFTFILLISSCSQDSASIVVVKTGRLTACPDRTVEAAVNAFFGSPEWESGVTETGVKFVNVGGDMKYMNKAVKGIVQFAISKDNKSFSYSAFEINEIPQNKLIALGLINKLCGK